MIEGKNVPKIRFPEFNGEWEEYELGQLMSRYEDHVETPHNGYERLGIRSHAKGVFHSHVNAGEELETAKMQRVAADKFIVNITFAWEHAVAITDENDAGLLVSHRFPQFSFDEKLQSGFFGFQMLDKRFKKHLELSSPGGAGRNRVLKIDDMMKYTVRIPSVAEQKKIASFLQMVDQIICEIQNDLDKWKELKRGMLQKMFPKEGESVPEIRFPGFSACWEKCKLSSASELITVGIANSATHAYTNSGIIMFRNQNIKENHLDDEDLIYINSAFEKGYEKKRIRENDILVTRTGNPGIACVVPKKYEGSQTFTTLILRLKNDISPHYVCQYINSDYGKQFFMSTQIGGGQKNTGAGILEEFPLIIPGRYEEQEMIADYLFRIDYLIMNQQRELNKWKELKKGLLQQMFV